MTSQIHALYMIKKILKFSSLNCLMHRGNGLVLKVQQISEMWRKLP